jgi:hypothetical protein
MFIEKDKIHSPIPCISPLFSLFLPLIVFVNVLERLFVMEETIKMKYVAPEIVDFKWMEGLGGCLDSGSTPVVGPCSNGLNANYQCSNGNTAGFTCSTQGNNAFTYEV